MSYWFECECGYSLRAALNFVGETQAKTMMANHLEVFKCDTPKARDN